MKNITLMKILSTTNFFAKHFFGRSIKKTEKNKYDINVDLILR